MSLKSMLTVPSFVSVLFASFFSVIAWGAEPTTETIRNAGVDPSAVCSECSCCAENGIDPCTGLNHCGKCPCCARCPEHLDQYGHDPQYFCDRDEKKMYLFHWTMYPGTLGRQAYARSFGYDHYKYRSNGRPMPAAYISHEYAASINRAVWEQLEAHRSVLELETAQRYLAEVSTLHENAQGKVAEWAEYLQQVTEEGDVCEMKSARCWLEKAVAAERELAKELAYALWLEDDRDQYMEFSIKRAKNSEKDARIASHHRRVFVKPPLDREALKVTSVPTDAEAAAAKEEKEKKRPTN